MEKFNSSIKKDLIDIMTKKGYTFTGESKKCLFFDMFKDDKPIYSADYYKEGAWFAYYDPNIVINLHVADE